jgi:transcriptional regulator with XRE-family HTH domain
MAPHVTVTTLERLRIERGLSRFQVARQAPVNRKTLKRLEDGVGEPRAPTIQKLAEFYGVRPDWLLREFRRDRFEADYEREPTAA